MKKIKIYLSILLVGLLLSCNNKRELTHGSEDILPDNPELWEDGDVYDAPEDKSIKEKVEEIFYPESKLSQRDLEIENIKLLKSRSKKESVEVANDGTIVNVTYSADAVERYSIGRYFYENDSIYNEEGYAYQIFDLVYASVIEHKLEYSDGRDPWTAKELEITLVSSDYLFCNLMGSNDSFFYKYARYRPETPNARDKSLKDLTIDVLINDNEGFNKIIKESRIYELENLEVFNKIRYEEVEKGNWLPVKTDLLSLKKFSPIYFTEHSGNIDFLFMRGGWAEGQEDFWRYSRVNVIQD